MAVRIVLAAGERVVVDGDAATVADRLRDNILVPFQAGDRVVYVNPPQVWYLEDEHSSVYEERGIITT